MVLNFIFLLQKKPAYNRRIIFQVYFAVNLLENSFSRTKRLLKRVKLEGAQAFHVYVCGVERKILAGNRVHVWP